MNKKVNFIDLGLINYDDGHRIQKEQFQEILDKKLVNRKLKKTEATQNYLIFCEHPHVYTLGRNGEKNNLLINNTQLLEKDATFHEIGRGGDITYHGPGQLVGYPIFDLDNFFTDIHKYLRYLEEAIILTCHHYGLKAGRVEGLTGVWINPEDPINTRKICALGVRASRWVTMHGFAFNINTDLSYFGHIVPCGISDKAVTSLQKELGRKVDFEEVKELVLKHLGNLFEFDIK